MILPRSIEDTLCVIRHPALEAHRKIVNVPFLCLLIFNLFQHVDRFNIARLFMVKKRCQRRSCQLSVIGPIAAGAMAERQ